MRLLKSAARGGVFTDRMENNGGTSLRTLRLIVNVQIGVRQFLDGRKRIADKIRSGMRECAAIGAEERIVQRVVNAGWTYAERRDATLYQAGEVVEFHRGSWSLAQDRQKRGSLQSAAAYRRELDERITQDQLGLDWKGELAAGVLMGSGAVVARWKRLLAKQSSSGSKSEGKRFWVVSWEEIVAAIEKEWGQPWEELRTGRGNNVRAMAIWFGRHRAGMKLEQVREQLQARSYTAVAMQVGRLQRQLPHQPKLRKRLRAIARHLNVQC